jgi:uncharacterized protein
MTGVRQIADQRPGGARALSTPVGIGLRADHYRAVLETRPAVGWLEVHSENYFGAGGTPLDYLERVRADYPLSLHGVGLSLGSTDALNPRHLQRLKTLVDRYEPLFVSEHLSWSSISGRYLNDLLPLPYTEEALRHLVPRIARVQDFLGRELLIENISSYLEFNDSAMPEWEFLTAVAQRAGCGILLDVNNIYVNAVNHGFDATHYLHAVPTAPVRELHLAGHTLNHFDGGSLLIDTHNRPVAEPVWALYGEAVRRFGDVPTLIEWDSDLPPLEVLLAEAARAAAIQETCHAQPA